MPEIAKSWLLQEDDTAFQSSLSDKSFEELRKTLEEAIASLSNDEIPFDSIAQIVKRSRLILDECNSRILATEVSLKAMSNGTPTAPPAINDEDEAF